MTIQANYTIANIDGDFYIVQESELSGNAIKAKLVTEPTNQRIIVRREGAFVESYLNMDGVEARLGQDEDDNYISIDGGYPVKVTWPQAQQFIHNAMERKDFQQKKDLGWDKS